MITARFYVAEMTRRAYDPSHVTVRLQPAYKDGRNAAWTKATPSGSIELQVNNPDAAAWFAERFDARRDLHITFGDVTDDA